ncbi:MAG: hypothetical protein RLY87_1823 [Chloroflexota bacterium]
MRLCKASAGAAAPIEYITDLDGHNPEADDFDDRGQESRDHPEGRVLIGQVGGIVVALTVFVMFLVLVAATTSDGARVDGVIGSGDECACDNQDGQNPTDDVQHRVMPPLLQVLCV